MPLLRTRVTNPIVWSLLIPLAFSGCKCKKDKGDDDQGDVVVQDVAVRLTITSIDPSRAPADKPFSATVRGSGFENGASVSFGAFEASRVTFLNGNQLGVEVPGMPVGRYDVEVSNPDGTSTLLRGGLSIDGAEFTACDPATVYFDTDKFTVSSDAKATLDSRAGCYKQTTGSVRVAGHADERGTTDYNLALGQKRADAVKKTIVTAGVEAAKVSTMSYGEEQPAASGSDEAAWAKNRRAEITVGR
jgi:peptidoglycan-associated lipoprotein